MADRFLLYVVFKIKIHSVKNSPPGIIVWVQEKGWIMSWLLTGSILCDAEDWEAW
jgi:hypothetical protein